MNGEKTIRSPHVGVTNKSKGEIAAARVRAKTNWHQILTSKNERKEARDMLGLRNVKGRYTRDS